MSSRRGRAARDVETVDLTLSSPSPSPEPSIRSQPQPRRQSSQQQPQVQPQQQSHQQRSHQRQQRPVSTKGEHRASSNKTAAGPSHRTSSTAPPAPKINEVYLRRLIDTAPVGVLKDLLFELCKTSPALSGAIVRGLAPHSIWAQNTIRDYQKRNVQAQVKPELASSSSAVLPPASSGVLNYGLSSTSRPKPSVKPKFDLPETDSDSSLKDLQFLMNPTTHHPKTPAKSRPDPFRSRSRNSARSDFKVPSATQDHPPNLSGRTVAGPSSSNHRAESSQILQTDRTPQNDGEPPLSSRVKSEPNPILPYCMQCEARVMPKSPCRFHVGRSKVQKKGTPTVRLWTCCKQPLDSVGCCEANHMLIKDPTSPSTDSSPPTVTKRSRLV